jgi:hypothetical protein
MSEFTTAILIHDQHLEELQNWVKKKKKNAYILPLTEDWIGLFIENDLHVGEKWAGTVSTEMLNSPRRFDPEGVNLLKKAFGLERLTFLSYDYLYSYSEESLVEEGVIKVSSQKRPVLKQVILEIFKEPLEERGYQLIPESGGRNMQHQYIFFKYIGSYRYQIHVENWEKNKLNLNYYPPYKLRSTEKWLNANDYCPEFTYSNELQMRNVLLKMLQHVMTKGLPWLEEQEVEEFNLSEAFRELLDPIMEQRGFYRKNIWEEFNGELWNLVYSAQDEKWRILFSRNKGFLAINVRVRRFNKEVVFYFDYPGKNTESFDNRFYYKTKQELGEQLDGVAHALFELMSRETILSYEDTLRGTNF